MDLRPNNMPSNELNSNAMNIVPAWLQGQKRIWVLGAAAYTILYSAWIFLKWTGPSNELFIANLGYLPLGLFSIISALYTSNQKKLDPRTRRAWQIIALSLIFLVAGDVLYFALELTRGRLDFPGIPDFFYLAFYPLAFTGVITIPTHLSDLAQEKTWKLDLAIIVTGATAILWFFLIVPTAVARGEGWAARLVAGAYPAMDVLLLASIASLLFRRSDISTRRSLYILGVGLLSYAIADIVYAGLVLQGLYHSGSWVDIIWTISYFIIGLAALRQAGAYYIEPKTKKAPLSTWLTSLPPFFIVIACAVTSLYAARSGIGVGIQTDGLYFGTLLTIILTVVRQVITMRENSRLVYELNFVSDQLRTNAQILEKRVHERTRELENQTNRLRLTAQIARDAASVRDVKSLLNRATALILERFNLYHTAIFLLDQQREYAILTASPTEAGQHMIAENYKLQIGSQNIIAEVAATGEPITVLESTDIRHPLLPDTRSEMALPLKVEGNLIGVLDVQSDKPEAFTQDDVAIMQILADQLATAIERTLLLDRVEQNLSELEQAYGQFTHESWNTFENRTLGLTGYRFDNVRIQPIKEIPAHGDEAIQTGKTVFHTNGTKPSEKNLVAIPIHLRGKTIGVVTVHLKEGYNQTTVSTLEAAIERLAASLESARLYEEARMRADRELSISRVTTAISASTEYEQILQTTVKEIGNLLSDTEVAIQIIDETTGGKRLERREQ
jgi:GAF domain-containing protein